MHTQEKMWGYVTILFATICDYVWFVIIFATTYQLHQIWGGFVTILWLMCNYYLIHPPMWMVIRLYSSMNKPPWPISCMCNQFNHKLMYNAHYGHDNHTYLGCTITKSSYTIIIIYHEYYQHICRV